MKISKKNAALICVLPGVLLASVFLSSSGIFNNAPFKLLPEDLSNFILILITIYGSVHLLIEILTRLIAIKD